jgi:hypothetical protein
VNPIPETSDILHMMIARVTPILILAAIALQGVFGSLQGSVLICLGGGHEHEQVEVVEHCDLECSHHSGLPAPTSSDEHLDDCGCTDIELGLIALLSTPRVADNDHYIVPPPPSMIVATRNDPTCTLLRKLPTKARGDPGGLRRLAAIRSTRLVV